MGLRAVVDAKATIIASGFTAEPVARGEAVLAVQQISELMVVAGVDIVGPLPAGAQESLLFSAAVFVAAPKPVEGAAVLALLASPAASEVFSRTGLLPIARRPEPAA